MRWAGHVAKKEKGRRALKILTGKPTGKRPSGRPRRDGRTIIECILKKQVQIRGIGLIRLSTRIIGELL